MPLSLLAASLVAVLFAVCPLLFFTDLTRNPYYTQIAILNAAICLLWIVWLVEDVRNKVIRWPYTALDLPLLTYIGFCIFSWALSMLLHPRFVSSIYAEGSKAGVFLIANTYLVYAASLRVSNRNHFKKLLWLTYAVATAAAAYGLAQYFGMEWIWGRNLNPYGSRPVSTFGNPNFMSSFLVLVIPVMVADLALGITKLDRLPLFIGTVVSTAALVATMTRSSWVGLLIALAIWAVWLYRLPERTEVERRWLGVLIGTLVAMIVFFPRGGDSGYQATVYSRLIEVREIAERRYGPVFQRLLIWISSWQMVLDHPISGKGWGNFELFYPFYQGTQLMEPAFKTLRTHANNSHNDILEHWAQVGTIGLGLYVWLWATFFRTSAAVVKRVEKTWRMLVVALAAAVAGMLIDNLLNVSVHFAVPAFLFWWWVGALYAQDPASVRWKEFSWSDWRVKLTVLLIILGLSFLVVRAFLFWKGEVYFFEGFKRSKGGDLIAAARALKRAYEYHPLEVNNNYELANVHARSGDREQALFMYQRALDSNGGYDEIYFNRGTVYMQLGRMEEAIQSYKVALGINPLSKEAYNALASVYLKDLPKYEKDVEELYKRSVRAYPDDKDFWNNLGYLYTQRKAWDLAFDAYKKAVELDPEFELGRRNLTVVVKHLPQRANEPVLTLDREWAALDALLNAGKFDEALARSKALEKEFPRSLRTQLLLGNIYFQKGHVADAIASYERGLTFHPDAAGLWQNLGLAYNRAGDSKKSRAAFERLLQLDPGNATAKAALGR